MEDVIGELDILYMTRVQKERFFNEADYIRLKDTYILDNSKMALAVSINSFRYIAVHILRIPAQPVTGCPRSIDPLVIAAESSLVNKTADML